MASLGPSLWGLLRRFSGHLIPKFGSVYDVGSEVNPIRDIWMDGTLHGVTVVSDHKVLVSADDTTSGFLEGKLVAGTNVTLTVNNPGANETITIAASGGGGAQTPWTSDIDADGFNLEGAGSVEGVTGQFETVNFPGAGGGFAGIIAHAAGQFVVTTGNGNIGSPSSITIKTADGTVGVPSPNTTIDVGATGGAGTGSILIGPSNASAVTVTPPTSFVADILAQADVVIANAGSGLTILSGVNARAGSSILVAGTVSIANTSVTANTKILYSRAAPGGGLGQLSYTSTPAIGFTFLSDDNTETSTIDWMLVEVP